MSTPVLQNHLPQSPWMSPATARLPGIQPLDPKNWIVRDEAFAGQMALRDGLIARHETRVHALLPHAKGAAIECLNLVLDSLAVDSGYTIAEDEVRRPDGVTVPFDTDRPLVTLGRLIQSDICLMQPGPDGHILAGAILCFPAGWTLSEKIGRPLARVHVPVPSYDQMVEKRVRRLFDAIRPGQVLWRANAHLYDDPTLFAPRTEDDPRPYVGLDSARFVRSERQTLRRLPESGAVVFGIHTYMVPIEMLEADQLETLGQIA